ncbi:VaFE repeat-containing surface-anchored protein [Candidatus Saccharibacteria bacterium]|nr:VaFE repeat-containing surface-anchored protein [Candidatus Saccharibacteria bacterium]
MRAKIKISKKVLVGVLTFLASAGIFYGVFRLTTNTRATSAGKYAWVSYGTSGTQVTYGTDTWSTQQYTVTENGVSDGTRLTTHAMCLEPIHQSPVGGGSTSLTTNNNQEMIQIMLATDSAYGHSAYSALSSNVTSVAATITNMSPTSGASAIFAVGHMMVGAANGDTSHLSATDITNINNLRTTISNWFSTNAPNDWQSYDLIVLDPNVVLDGYTLANKQAVGWLELNGYTPTPTPTTETGLIQLFKYDSMTGYAAAISNGTGTLSGATFRVYKYGSSTTLATLTTGSNGFTPTYEADEDEVICFQETSAPSGYDLDDTPQCGTIVANSTVLVNMANTPTVSGGIKIRKIDATTGGSTNGGASVVGSTFVVYKYGTSTQVASFTIDTDLGANGATGQTAADALPAGSYTVKELTASTGYSLNTTQSIDFTIDSTHQGLQDYSTNSTYYFSNTVKAGDLEITKYKADKDGATTAFSGVGFKIYRVVSGTETYVSTITTDSTGKAATSGSALTYGTYKLYEVAGDNNEAYDVDESTAVATVTVGEYDGTVVTAPAVTNTLRDDPTLSTLARNSAYSSRDETGATTLPISTSAGVTDKVVFDSLTTGLLYKLEGELWVNDNTIFDPVATTEKVWEHGTESYIDVAFTNVDTSALMGKELGIIQKLYVCTGGHTAGTTTCDGDEWELLANHNENLAEADEMVTVETLGLTTRATSERATANEKTLTAGTVTVLDTVTLHGLTNGETYFIRSQLMDEDGNAITLTSGETSDLTNYIMMATTGSTVNTTMELEFDSSAYIGQTITVYETLYDSEMNELVSHKVLGDAAQSLTVVAPEIDTTAENGASSGSKTLYISSEATIKDTIVLTGLTPNTTYSLSSTVYLVEEDDDGTRTRGEKVLGPVTTGHGFTTGSSENYTAEVTLTLDTMDLAGKELVVYETLYYGTTAIALHTDPTDTDQIVTVGTLGIGTTARDGADGETDNVIEPEAGAKILDTVSYTGLTPGETYYLEGEVMQKTSSSTGKALEIDGAPVAKTAEFTADADGAGEVEILFTFDASELPGEELVVYETLYQVIDGTQVTLAEHKDIKDGNQTVKVRPRIGTKAVDKYDSDQTLGVGSATIVDTVAYEGLTDGASYTMKGYLVLVDGTEVSEIDGAEAVVEFTIGEEGTEETDGTVEMEFTIDTAEYAGKKIVVFEELLDADENLVAEHKDTTDASQTVTVATPGITTTAKDKLDDDKELERNSTVIIVDEVAYTGLVPGTTYTLRGELRDKATGELFQLADGTEVEPVYLEFTPDRDAGSVQMEFEFDSTGLSGKEIVVFERLYLGEEPAEDEELEEEDLIAKHEDLEAYAQTVWVRVVTPNTGAVTRGLEGAKARGVYAALAGISLASVAGFVTLRYYKKNRFGF